MNDNIHENFLDFLVKNGVEYKEFVKWPNSECNKWYLKWQSEITGIGFNELSSNVDINSDMFGLSYLPGRVTRGAHTCDITYYVDYEDGIDIISGILSGILINEDASGGLSLNYTGGLSEDNQVVFNNFKQYGFNINNVPEDKRGYYVEQGWKFNEDGDVVAVPNFILKDCFRFDGDSYLVDPDTFDSHSWIGFISSPDWYPSYLGFHQENGLGFDVTEGGMIKITNRRTGRIDENGEYHFELNSHIFNPRADMDWNNWYYGFNGVNSDVFGIDDPSLHYSFDIMAAGNDEYIVHYNNFMADSFAFGLNDKYNTSRFKVSFDNYTGSIDEFFDQQFYIQHNGLKIPLPADIYAKGKDCSKSTTEYVEELISSDLHDYNSFGFSLSVLIDHDDSVSSIGYEKVERTDDEYYKVYFNNGQVITLDYSQLLEFCGQNGEFSLGQFYDKTSNTIVYKNNKIDEFLTSKYNLDSVGVDVRFNDVTGQYMIYINGQIYNVNKNLISFNEDGTLDEAAFSDLLNDGALLPNPDDVEAMHVENQYIANVYFTPCLNINDEKFYKKMVSDLKNLAEKELFPVTKSKLNDVNGRITPIVGTIELTLDQKMSEFQNECLNLSEQIDKCVNMLISCDDGLKAYLDTIIYSVFEETDLKTGTINLIDDKDDAVAIQNLIKKELEIFDASVKNSILYASGFLLLDDSDVSAYGFNPEDFEQQEINGQIFYVVSTEYLKTTLNLNGNSVYDWVANYITPEERQKYSSLVDQINISSEFVSHSDAVLLMKDNVDALKKRSKYLSYCFDDSFYPKLEKIRNDPSCSIDFLSYAEQALFEVAFAKEYNISSPELFNFKDILDNYSFDSFDFKVNNDYDTIMVSLVYNILSDITNNQVKERKGYVDCLKEMLSWYENGQVDFGEAFAYCADKFGDGLLNIPRGLWHLFSPENTDAEWKDLFMANMLGQKDIASLEELDKKYLAGEISPIEYKVRKDVFGYYEENGGHGYDPKSVVAVGDGCEFAGELVAEIALDIISYGGASAFKAGSKVPKVINLVKDAVKCYSKAGWKANEAYEIQGVDEWGARLFGIAYGSITFGAKTGLKYLDKRLLDGKPVGLGGVNVDDALREYVAAGTMGAGSIDFCNTRRFKVANWLVGHHLSGPVDTLVNKLFVEQLINFEDTSTTTGLLLLELISGIDTGKELTWKDMGILNLWCVDGQDVIKVGRESISSGLTDYLFN